MDLNYLQTEIIPEREKEIKNGENSSTRQPIYVVLDLKENYVEGHSVFDLNTNYMGKEAEFGCFNMSLDEEDRAFRKCSEENTFNPFTATKFYTDKIIAFFLTRKAAREYLKYQKHNLSNPYIYVFYSGHGNEQMDKLLCNQ